MRSISEMMAACNDPKRNEATAYPWWMIIDPKGLGLCSMSQRIHRVAYAVTGPFFSRETATEHLNAYHHRFSLHARVYCSSGHSSEDWKELLKLSRAEETPDAE